jgi:hypothetical protein
MPNLQDYYNDLLTWEGLPPRNLVDPWPGVLRATIENDLINATSLSGLIGANCAIHQGSSNQSVGNQVEAFTVGILSPHLVDYRLLPCSGSGYPDKVIIERGTNLAIPLEMKATSDWNPRDSNRRVLTSSSKKLRAQFVGPIHHLLATVIYSPVSKGIRIDHLRLDFLEPTTPVSVRLEASVNHRILANGSHHSRVI